MLIRRTAFDVQLQLDCYGLGESSFVYAVKPYSKIMRGNIYIIHVVCIYAHADNSWDNLYLPMVSHRNCINLLHCFMGKYKRSQLSTV